MTIFNYQKLNRAQHHVECSVNIIAANAAITHKLNSICNNKCTSCKKKNYRSGTVILVHKFIY